MLDEEYCLKAINFDLNTKALKQYYPLSNWRRAYDDINKLLLANGFEHRQGSGYFSKQKMRKTELSSIIKILSLQFPWLKKCVKQFDVTNIGAQYSALGLILDETPDIEISELSGNSQYTSKLDAVLDTADKIEEAIDTCAIDKEQSQGWER